MLLGETQRAQNTNADDLIMDAILLTDKLLLPNAVAKKSTHDFTKPLNTNFCTICLRLTVISKEKVCAPRGRKFGGVGGLKMR